MENSDWIDNPPEDIESIVALLERHGQYIDEDSPKGTTLRLLLRQARQEYDKATDNLKRNEPQAFWKPSLRTSPATKQLDFWLQFPDLLRGEPNRQNNCVRIQRNPLDFPE